MNHQLTSTQAFWLGHLHDAFSVGHIVSHYSDQQGSCEVPRPQLLQAREARSGILFQGDWSSLNLCEKQPELLKPDRVPQWTQVKAVTSMVLPCQVSVCVSK